MKHVSYNWNLTCCKGANKARAVSASAIAGKGRVLE